MLPYKSKVQLKDVVSKQLPEYIREGYPTFVAFVEAYYEFLENSSVDLSKIRDIDETLDSFVQYFKKELAHNYPANVANERFLLQHVKDQYLAKGSEASYRLLFRLLYGKEIYMDYPGKSMLRVSDGRWKQDVSLMVRVDAGDPNFIIGKIVDVQTAKKIYRSAVNPNTLRITKVTANVENVSVVDEGAKLYEIFLDRNFYGEINPGDVIKLGSDFQALVLPVTVKLKIQNQGRDFKPGQVFQVSSGQGTAIWFKVTSVEDEPENNIKGKLKTIDIIKFGRGYDTDFSITILPSSAVRASKKIEQQLSTISYSKVTGNIGVIDVLTGGSGYTLPPTVVIGGNGSGAEAHAVLGTGDEAGQVVAIVMDSLGDGYTTGFANLVNAVGDTTGFGATAEVTLGDTYSYVTNDIGKGFNELGYINYGDYWDHEVADGAYVGTIARQFYLDAKDSQGANPALINVTLGALAKYPGYYKTNDGFLDDAMFVQDSYYYQAFSYVIRIDEQLQSYASAVRSMLHPSGMALFGEYSINNQIDLSIALEILIKSLGVTFYDEFFVTEVATIKFFKDVSDAIEVPEGGSSILDSITAKYFSKALETSFNTPVDSAVLAFTKRANEYITETSEITAKTFGKLNNDSPVVTEAMTRVMGRRITESYAGMSDTPAKTVSKPLADSQSIADAIASRVFTKIVTGLNSAVILEDVTRNTGKSLSDSYVSSNVTEVVTRNTGKGLTETPLATDSPAKATTKYVTDTTIGTFTQSGYVTKNPYEEGGYFLELYANAYESTF